MKCVICKADATKRGSRDIIPHGRMCSSCSYCFFCWKKGRKWLRKYVG